MKYRIWILLIFIPIVVLCDDCTSDEDVIADLLGRNSHSSGEIVIKSNYKIAKWLYNSVAHELSTEGFFEMSWTNTTLDFTNLNACHKTVRIKSLLHIFWLPHVYFPFSYNLEESRNLYNIEIHESGNITLSKRLKQSIPCKEQSDSHPFSNNTCTLSWKYTNLDNYQKIVIEPSNLMDSVEREHSRQFILKDVTFESSGDDEQRLHYTITQTPQYLLLHFFFPALLFLIPPWLSLLLGPMAITRCIILMTSLILLSNHYDRNVTVFPIDASLNAISIWQLFTYIYVIGIVIELIIITLFASMGRSKTCCFAKRRSAKYEMEPLYEEMNDLRQRKTRKTRNCCRKAALFVDIASFIFFGLILVLFCYGFYTQRDSAVKMIHEFDMESLNIF
ncbi:Neurotransmitter-gated ion-channel ligand-binding domain-containing protein [Caenorhabditis elegans]|uniref:Neurotransmitter-gated ion-channel ligand-binding domain-containing protein n=1 Tax=Caenorhabditis elegans TaxID=6239 RepID=Q22588_CAEEL|nr:Neurotransmitter-gated ion-channel ligand-binding domain-containing protein [Caenorhabditis elegans]CCD73156.2 Neurotransmitter-gated ion-channel ligand-binding domain-containing protein [Caenorhabditis elegans]|eukprot:NP_508139.2 Ligand-Gated ion Channel [Caenorhabditis elegans]